MMEVNSLTLFRYTLIQHNPVRLDICFNPVVSPDNVLGFMSSVDLHTHSGFQRMLPESFAVVCAPSSTPKYVPHVFSTRLYLTYDLPALASSD